MLPASPSLLDEGDGVDAADGDAIAAMDATRHSVPVEVGPTRCQWPESLDECTRWQMARTVAHRSAGEYTLDDLISMGNTVVRIDESRRRQ